MNTRGSGIRAWLLQRLSAVYMALYMVFFLLSFAWEPPVGYSAWREFVAAPAMSVATLLLFALLLGHAWVGVRDVVMDYVHAFFFRFVVLITVAAALLAMGIWAALVLLAGGLR
ncbi:MAG TPA: succinate dehydrogenase, hydrophobic membrane anchor protein [Gammaproteobacteria bacterium]|nr:succinate dehydrogenase, hydrophobic membrane anchor protein [Gammaproteobacteria bacterium]